MDIRPPPSRTRAPKPPPTPTAHPCNQSANQTTWTAATRLLWIELVHRFAECVGYSRCEERFQMAWKEQSEYSRREMTMPIRLKLHNHLYGVRPGTVVKKH